MSWIWIEVAENTALLLVSVYPWVRKERTDTGLNMKARLQKALEFKLSKDDNTHMPKMPGLLTDTERVWAFYSMLHVSSSIVSLSGDEQSIALFPS